MHTVPLALAGLAALPAPALAPAAAGSGAVLYDVVKLVGAAVVVADVERGNKFRRAAPDTEVAGQREWKPRPRDRQETSSDVARRTFIASLGIVHCTAVNSPTLVLVLLDLLLPVSRVQTDSPVSCVST